MHDQTAAMVCRTEKDSSVLLSSRISRLRQECETPRVSSHGTVLVKNTGDFTTLLRSRALWSSTVIGWGCHIRFSRVAAPRCGLARHGSGQFKIGLWSAYPEGRRPQQPEKRQQDYQDGRYCQRAVFSHLRQTPNRLKARRCCSRSSGARNRKRNCLCFNWTVSARFRNASVLRGRVPGFSLHVI